MHGLKRAKNARSIDARLPSIETERYKDAATSSCDESRKTERDKVRALLIGAGVNEPALSTLARRCTLADIEKQLDWMQYRSGIRNASSALISALMENWAEPEAAQKRREAAAARRAQDQRAAAAKGLVEAIGAVYCTDDDLWKLPSMERHLLCDRARRELGGDSAASLYGEDEFAQMCRTYALHLLDRRRAS